MVKNTILSLLLALCYASVAMAQEPTDTILTSLEQSTDTVHMHRYIYERVYSVGIVANAGNSELAPYYISSNCGGTTTQQYSALVYAAAKLWNGSLHKRFSWGAGLEAWGGYASSAGYQRYAGNGQFEEQKQHPARVWIQ